MTTDELAPPRKSTELQDPGAHELGEARSFSIANILLTPCSESESDEHFSDASEGRPARALPHTSDRSEATSPIPVTRVERVDDEPAYGEVPGTDAYNKRAQDAVPDEVEIVPDGTRSRSASRLNAEDRPLTPGGTPIPKTIVEKVDPDTPSHGEVPGTDAYNKRLQDAVPDVVRAVPDVIVKAPEPPQRKTSGM